MGHHGELEKICQEAIAGGVSIIQMREKRGSTLELLNLAKRFKAICTHSKIPLIINDRLDIALAIEADGVHLGQEDMPCKEARRILQDKIIGVSVHNVHQAQKAQEEGADYLGVGAMFATGSKQDAKLLSLDELRKIRQATSLPIVIIGGLNSQNIAQFKNEGIDGIAVISAILDSEDREMSARKLREQWDLKQ